MNWPITSRPTPELQERLAVFVLAAYAEGRSLREIAELTDRSFSAIRNLLERHGVHRRSVGATRIDRSPPRLRLG